jgi:hypothetical protein
MAKVYRVDRKHAPLVCMLATKAMAPEAPSLASTAADGRSFKTVSAVTAAGRRAVSWLGRDCPLRNPAVDRMIFNDDGAVHWSCEFGAQGDHHGPYNDDNRYWYEARNVNRKLHVLLFVVGTAAVASGCIQSSAGPNPNAQGGTGGPSVGPALSPESGGSQSPSISAGGADGTSDAGTHTAPSINGGGQAGGLADSGPTTPVPEAGAKNSHYPLADGAVWVYHHTKPNKADWDETDTMRAATYKGEPAFVLEDQEDKQGVQTHSTLKNDGSGIYRVYQEDTVSGQVADSVTYAPAFLRFDESWTKNGQTVTLTDNWTRTCVLGGTAAASCATGAVTPGMTTHVYTVIDAAARVSVPAGMFDAVEVQRVDPNTSETKLYWFAAGVGKVRDENPMSMAVSELTSYTIP